jgi:ABC-type Fe3+ transport system substrate-binding protein
MRSFMGGLSIFAAIGAAAALALLFEVESLAAAEPRSDWQAQWEQTLKAAKKEGQVVFYSASRYEAVFGEFQKKYPEIKVVPVTTGLPPDLAQRMMTERRAGKYLVDLYIAGASTMHRVLYKGKALDPIKPALILPEVVDESKWWLGGKYNFADEDGKYIFAFNGEIQPYFAYNTKLVDPNQIKSYWDLLRAKWKGKMVALDPTIGGPVATPLRLLYYTPGLGPEYLRKLLGEMDLTASRDPFQIVNWLAAGKFAISIFTAANRSDLPTAKKQGLPVDWFPPKNFREGAILSSASGNIGLINRAPHPNAARVAINWLLSREGQIVYQKFEPGQDSLRIDIPKDDVPDYSRRVEGANYVVTERPEWMDVKPILEVVNEVWKRRK